MRFIARWKGKRHKLEMRARNLLYCWVVQNCKVCKVAKWHCVCAATLGRFTFCDHLQAADHFGSAWCRNESATASYCGFPVWASFAVESLHQITDHWKLAWVSHNFFSDDENGVQQPVDNCAAFISRCVPNVLLQFRSSTPRCDIAWFASERIHAPQHQCSAICDRKPEGKCQKNYLCN